MISMKIAVFSKPRTTKDGRPFTSYLATLTRKSTGERFTVSVRFRQECGEPKKCPRWIEIPKGACNLNESSVITEDGREVISRILWVSEFKDAGEWVDTSMDDIE